MGRGPTPRRTENSSSFTARLIGSIRSPTNHTIAVRRAESSGICSTCSTLNHVRCSVGRLTLCGMLFRFATTYLTTTKFVNGITARNTMQITNTRTVQPVATLLSSCCQAAVTYIKFHIQVCLYTGMRVSSTPTTHSQPRPLPSPTH